MQRTYRISRSGGTGASTQVIASDADEHGYAKMATRDFADTPTNRGIKINLWLDGEVIYSYTCNPL